MSQEEKEIKEIELTEEKLKETLGKAKIESDSKKIIIETNGTDFKVDLNGVSRLELKEICRELLFKLGG